MCIATYQECRVNRAPNTPEPIRAQRDGVFPDSSTILMPYFDARWQVQSPDGSVRSERGLSRFIAKMCIV